MDCNTFLLSDLSYTCEGCCWELGGASELVGSMGCFLHFQLPFELESLRLGGGLLNLVQNHQQSLANVSVNGSFFFHFRYIFHLRWIFCSDHSFCGKSSARNKGENIGRNSSIHQFLESKRDICK